MTTIDAPPGVLIFAFMAAIFASSALSFTLGYSDGESHGVMLAHAEQGVHVSENDRVMQRLGVCEWAKQENTRCNQNLK
jgi:hypothetical protein